MLTNNFSGLKFEAGIDEAGRGSLAGPVTASSVILPKDFNNFELNDSKKLSHKKRLYLKKVIEENAIAYSVSFIYELKIDKINILNATILAMHNSLSSLNIIPDFILVDGNNFRQYKNIPFKCIVKGDQKYQSIAAASILAKTYRDIYMEKIDNEFPKYFWKDNKGYGTFNHIKMINKYGLTKYHRKSFTIKTKQLNIKFEHEA